jgi:deazaflavin-dependent oxidoreductase (nitroreductase family)
VGRRTGIIRRTPLRGFVREDTLYLGLNHGNRVDWCRNVEAAGRCRVQYRGQWHECAAPRVVPFATVSNCFPQPERVLMARLLRTDRVLVLPLDIPPPQTRPWRYTVAAAATASLAAALVSRRRRTTEPIRRRRRMQAFDGGSSG